MSIESEKKTIETMIRLYCRENHGGCEQLCGDCTQLLDYAKARLDKCPFGDNKPVCKDCEIHCYQPDMRARVSEVMKFSGPRMFKEDPIGAIRHLLHTLRKKKR